MPRGRSAADGRRAGLLFALAVVICSTAYWSQSVSQVDSGFLWITGGVLASLLALIGILGIIEKPKPDLATWITIGRRLVAWAVQTPWRTVAALAAMAAWLGLLWWIGPRSTYVFAIRCNGAAQVEWVDRSRLSRSVDCPRSLAMWQPFRSASSVLARIRCVSGEGIVSVVEASSDGAVLSCPLPPSPPPAATSTPVGEPTPRPPSTPTTVSEIAILLADPREPRRAGAREALLAMDPKQAVRLLAELLKDRRAEGRAGAAVGLGLWGKEAEPAVPALVEALTDGDAAVRTAAANSLKSMGPASGRAVPALKNALGDEVGSVRIEAAVTLIKLGREQDVAIDCLIAGLRDPWAGTRIAAAGALGRVGVVGQRAVPDLALLLKDKEAAMQAAETLGQIGPAARAAIPALREASRQEPLRPWAEAAIARIRR